MFSYNTAIHKATNYSPFEFLFGHKPYLPSSIIYESRFHYSYDDYIKALQYKLNTSFKIAREKILTNKERSKETANPENFNKNDLVFIYQNQIKVGQSKKRSHHFKDPYKITRVHLNQTVDLLIGKKTVRYHMNLLKKYFSDEIDSSDSLANPVPS